MPIMQCCTPLSSVVFHHSILQVIMVVSTVLQRNPEVNFEATLNLDDVSHVGTIQNDVIISPINNGENTNR